MFQRLLKPKPAQTAGQTLYSGAVAQARQPGFYTAFGAPDTREGRFELYSLHVILLLDRLRGEGAQAEETAQALVDRFTRGLDDAFREMGVGDMAVAKRVKNLAQAFLGRAKVCHEAFDALPDRSSLEGLVARTLFDEDGGKAAGLTGYLIAAREHLAGQPLQTLLEGHAEWPAP